MLPEGAVQRRRILVDLHDNFTAFLKFPRHESLKTCETSADRLLSLATEAISANDISSSENLTGQSGSGILRGTLARAPRALRMRSARAPRTLRARPLLPLGCRSPLLLLLLLLILLPLLLLLLLLPVHQIDHKDEHTFPHTT